MLKNSSGPAKPPVLAGVSLLWRDREVLVKKKDISILMMKIIETQMLFTAIPHLNLQYGLKV
jgi:hypothetical protein